MKLNRIKTRKALNSEYRQHNPKRSEVNSFRAELKNCLVSIKSAEEVNESEEFIKTPIATFLKNTFYVDNLVNTKGRIDLAIYTGKDLNSDVGVIIEAKKPSNKSEFISEENLNRKALQELLLYYLRERIDNKNNNIKTLIATNGYEWYLFKGEHFYKYFYKNTSLIKEYNAFKDGQKDSEKTELFYSEIAKKYIAEIESELPFVYLNFTKKRLEDYTDQSLNTLYKVFSDVNILGNSFGNDSNALNKDFYNELLHIIGLEETKDKGKKVIYRKDEKKRDYASLLENAIFKLEDQDHLNKVKNYTEDKAFNVGLTLCLTWVNRILFLKLLESQLQTYHPAEKEKYSFLNSNFISGFNDLNDLFFSALAKDIKDRHPKFKDKYQYIPYLNSSLFEMSSLEKDTIEITKLNDDEIEVYKTTVLKENGKRFKGKLSTLEYLFKFLDCFDFATDGTEGISDEEESKTLINASVLGLIFEKINGYKEGSFYTPAYITMYMCKETLRMAVVQKFKEKENEDIETFEDLKNYCIRFFKHEDIKKLNDIINSLKVCDPAVGSGHFLVSALNELIVIKHELGLLVDLKGGSLNRYDINIENDELYITDENGHLIVYKHENTESARVQHTLFHAKQTIIENCLFGVDINPISVKICRLRLWVELLKNAYYTKEGVFQTLPNIDINIKCGNSLISRFDLQDDLKDAFKGKDVKYSFNEYRDAVNQYKQSNSKKEKKAVLEIIKEVKNNFKSSLDKKFSNKLTKLELELNVENDRINNMSLFGEKITKAEKDRLKVLKKNFKEAFSEKQRIVNNKIYDNAFEWRFEFPEVLDEAGYYIGFDAVIGNPPYMRVQEIQKTQPLEKKHYEVYYEIAKSSYDLANLFFERAINISNANAKNSYIFPHKFFNSASTTNFRDYLTKGEYIDKLTHFGANMIFDEADTYTCIANFSKIENKGFNIYKAKFKSSFQTEMLNNENYGFVTYEQLKQLSELYGSNQWILLDGQKSISLFEKLYQSGTVLKDKFDRIFQGIATGKDDLYVFTGAVKGKYVLGNFKNSESLEIEKGILKPFIKGKDVHRYDILPNNKFILFPYIINGEGKGEIMTESYIEQNFPKAYKWLKVTEPLHRKKDSKSTNDDFWYRYARKQGLNNVEQPKLSSMEICSKHPNITVNNDYYHSTTVYSWVKKANTIESYEYFLSIVNSKLLWWFLMNTGDILQGDARRLKTNYLNPFPLPKDNDKELLLTEKVNQILILKNENIDADTTALEKEIDQMVYKLYGLTDAEIQIVEESQNK